MRGQRPDRRERSTPDQARAGTASSAQGFISTTFGSLLGFLIGQQFDGSVAPMALGFTGLGLMALLCVLIAERGRLFRARHPVPAPARA